MFQASETNIYEAGSNVSMKSLLLALTLTTMGLSACSNNEASQLPPLPTSVPELTVRRTLISHTSEFDGVLINPAACAFDSAGTLYVLDSGSGQILVLDESLTVTDVYGGLGNGPGELPPLVKAMAIGAGRIAVYRWPIVHLFTLDGEFLTRFPVDEHAEDIDIAPDGTIIACVYHEGIQLIGWDQEGNELFRRGRPFLPIPYEREMGVLIKANEAMVDVLEDGVVAVFGELWTRVRFYREDEFDEHTIDLRLLPTEEGFEDLYERIMEDRRQHSLEKAYEHFTRGSLTQNELPHMYRITVPYLTAHDANDLWIGNQGTFFQIDRKGTIERICLWYRAEETAGLCVDFAVSGERFALCFTNDWDGNGIAVGTMQFHNQ